jgi:DNA-binding IclR family transcriptional regulator
MTIAEMMAVSAHHGRTRLCDLRTEYEDEINAVAAPIFDKDRQPIASIAIVGPSYRLTKDRLPSLGESLRQLTQSITNEVGIAALSAIVRKTRTR